MSVKGKRRLFAIIVVAIAGATVAWVALRPRDELSLREKSPSTLQAIPRARIGSKPWVNFALGSFKIVYPQPNVVPPEFGQIPGSSGLLLSESAISPWEGAGWTGTAAWIVNGNQIPAGPSFLGSSLDAKKADVWPCPYVFGDKPIDVDLKPSPWSETTIKLRLPPNHQPAPAVKDHSVEFGEYTVRLKPKPWISPSFPLRFDVSVDGAKKDEAFLLTFTEALDGSANLRVRPGETAELSLQNWDASWGVLMQIQKVRIVPVRLAVTRTPLTGGRDVLKFSTDDTTIAEVTIDKSQNTVENETNYDLAGYASIQIGDYWPFGEFQRRNTYGRFSSERSATPFAKFKDGDIVEAIGYKGELPFVQRDFVMNLPDPKKIVGTRAYLPDGAR